MARLSGFRGALFRISATFVCRDCAPRLPPVSRTVYAEDVRREQAALEAGEELRPRPDWIGIYDTIDGRAIVDFAAVDVLGKACNYCGRWPSEVLGGALPPAPLPPCTGGLP